MLAAGMPSRVIWYSWSRRLPSTASSPPPSSSTVKRSRRGVMRAFLTVATLSLPALDGHGVSGPQQPFLELEELVAAGVLDDHGVARPQHLVVDLEDPLAAVVLDPEVVAEADQLLPEQVPGARRRPLGLVVSSSPEHRSPPWWRPHRGTGPGAGASPAWG